MVSVVDTSVRAQTGRNKHCDIYRIGNLFHELDVGGRWENRLKGRIESSGEKSFTGLPETMAWIDKLELTGSPTLEAAGVGP